MTQEEVIKLLNERIESEEDECLERYKENKTHEDWGMTTPRELLRAVSDNDIELDLHEKEAWDSGYLTGLKDAIRIIKENFYN